MSDKTLKAQLLRSRTTQIGDEKATRFPAPPVHLEPDERRIWRRTLRDFDIRDGAALAVLESALSAHMRFRRCRESIAKVGELIKDGKGGIRSHPLLCHERDARAAFLAGMRALGVLDPEAA